MAWRPRTVKGLLFQSDAVVFEACLGSAIARRWETPIIVGSQSSEEIIAEAIAAGHIVTEMTVDDFLHDFESKVKVTLIV